jgi:hypothetical protein
MSRRTVSGYRSIAVNGAGLWSGGDGFDTVRVVLKAVVNREWKIIRDETLKISSSTGEIIQAEPTLPE